MHPLPLLDPPLQTPDIHAQVTKKAFTRVVSQWRTRLHFWDDVSVSSAVTSAGAQATEVEPGQDATPTANDKLVVV